MPQGLIGKNGLNMKWPHQMAALILMGSLGFAVSGPAWGAAAKGQSKASQNKTVDDIDLDDAKTPTGVIQTQAPTTAPAAPTAATPQTTTTVKALPKPTPKSTPKPAPRSKAVTVKQSVAKGKPAPSLDDIQLDEDPPAKKVEPRNAAVESAIDQAQLLEAKKEYTKIIELLMPKTNLLTRRGLLALARAQKGSGDGQGELKTLQLCLAKNPKDYVVDTFLADAYSRAKRGDDAVATYQEAQSWNKLYEPAYDGLWMEYERQKQYYEARSVLNDMIKLFGDKPKFYSALCRLYSIDDYLGKSTEICRIAIQKDPKEVGNYVNLGMSLKDQESAPEAEKIVEDAAKRFTNSEAIQSMAGTLRLEKKDYATAYDFFRRAVQADKTSARAWQGLANTAFELQKNEEALDAFAHECSIDRHLSKDLRVAISKLHARKDSAWIMRFEDRLAKCSD